MDLHFGKPFPPNIKTIAGSGWRQPRQGGTEWHSGLDLWVPVGTPVLAVADGEVYFTGWDSAGSGGNYVKIKHTNGWHSRYFHLSRYVVAKGQRVKKGQLIAYSGNTGVGSTGPHLHLDLRLEPLMVPFIEALVGRPKDGYKTHAGLVAVPGEPWIPVDSYAQKVIDKAREYNIPLYSQWSHPTSGFLVPVIVLFSAAAAAVTWIVARRIRSRRVLVP